MGIFGWLRGEQKPADSETLASPAPTSQDIEAALVKAERMAIEGHAPTPVLARVLRIITVVRAIVPRLGNLGLDSQDAYTVVATATDYLPESVAGYLALPRDWADTRPVANGKSSLLLLVVAGFAATMGGFIGVAAMAFAGALLAAFMFSGLATLHDLSRGRVWRMPMLISIYVALIVMQAVLTPLLAIAGVIDTLLGLRKRAALPPPPNRS